MKLRELAEHLGCRLEGDGDIEITGVAGIESAGPGQITFLANAKYQAVLARTNASAVILRDEHLSAPCAILRTPDPYLMFARAVGVFAPAWRPISGIHGMAAVSSSATVGQDVSIGAFVAVGEAARIGARTVVFPNDLLRLRTQTAPAYRLAREWSSVRPTGARTQATSFRKVIFIPLRCRC